MNGSERTINHWTIINPANPKKHTHNQKKERFEINQEEPSQQTNIKKMQTEQKTKRTIQKHN
jgi:hypothetical protein